MKTKLILEIGCNHQGNIGLARTMIHTAKELGAWGVKFQKRDMGAIPPALASKARDMRNSFGDTYGEHRKALEFDIDQIVDLKMEAESVGIEFICSAFDQPSIDVLIEAGVENIKLPSQLYLSDDLGQYLRKKNVNIYVSTGMHNLAEIVSSQWIKEAVVIFHCISSYPATLSSMNLITIERLKFYAKKAAAIGYSSHEIRGAGIGPAVIAGATVIERHFTLDKTLKGSDHSTVSSDPQEVARIIGEIKRAEELLGEDARECSPSELMNRKVYRGF